MWHSQLTCDPAPKPKIRIRKAQEYTRARGRALTGQASEDLAAGEGCVHEKAKNRFRDGFAHESKMKPRGANQHMNDDDDDMGSGSGFHWG